MIRVYVAPIVALALCGCASTMSGVGGAQGYACKAPEGALCTSVSGVYANSVQGAPAAAKPHATKSPSASPALYGASPIAPGSAAATPGAAMRSSPRVLRLWIAPWEDADGDLHEEAFLHVLVDTGRWLIEHIRPVLRPRVDGIAPPASSVRDTSPTRAASEAPSPSSARFPMPSASESSGAETSPTEP